MLRSMFLALLVALLTGCVNTATVKLDNDKLKALHGKSLVVSTSDKPDFAAMTAGKAMFAMIGAIAMITAGNEIIRTHEVDDPAVFIGAEVAKKLANLQEMDLTSSPVPSSDDGIEYLSSVHANKDYALDVRTLNWSFGYFPTDWDNYRVMYSAKVRLIDLAEAEVVAEAFCSRVPEQSPESPTYEQLVGDDAARLKSELQTAAEHCVKELSEKLL